MKILDFELMKLLKEYKKIVAKPKKSLRDFTFLSIAERELYNNGLISRYELSSRHRKMLEHYEQVYKSQGLEVPCDLKI